MRLGFYARLACDGIRKNRQLYIPYLLTCSLMVCVFYIMRFLTLSDLLSHMSGGGSLRLVLGLGSFVIAVFSLLFLFYTGSFLMRRRRKEFGLYHVLGLSKRDLRRLLLLETLFSYCLCMGAGLAMGIGLSKLAELCLLNLIREEISYRFQVFPAGIRYTMTFFAAIHAIIWLCNVVRIRLTGTLDLVRSENIGEKPPRGNAILGISGLILLGIAYYLAVSIQQPLTALLYFFLAVLLVIAATYLIFIAGSVLLCRLLQKNKKYYYQSAHFISVSSMAYRMRRNGAGLATICILLIMVLVMVSSSACLYFGADSALTAKYPRDTAALPAGTATARATGTWQIP